MSILVVDDSSFARFQVREELQSEYSVLEASDGASCLEVLKTQPVKLVTLDIEMSGMDGFEVCHKIRTHSDQRDCQISNVPIIFVTSKDDLNERLKGYDVGGSDFFSKPFPKGMLLHRVNEILNPQTKYRDMSILVVEDDLITQRLMAEALSSLGVRLEFASHGREALDFVARPKNSYDLILTDQNMPIMDGIEMCKRIRKGFGLANLPIMFVCGESELDLTLNIFKAGATSLHRKPFIREDLLANVKAHLNNKLVEKRLKQVNEQLAELADVKSQFLANMSHEIRTPINGILGLTQFTLEEEIDESHRGNLELVHSSAEHLLDVVNDILDLSKLESGKFLASSLPFHLKDCVQRVFSQIEAGCNEKSLEFVLSFPAKCPGMVLGDERMLRQILFNLLGNAAKFTPECGVVHLYIECNKEEEGSQIELTFSIADSGIGISDQMMSAIFDPFRQADETHSRQFGGTGLGLAITSEFVNLLGGKIWVDSKVGIGSSFHFAVPFEVYHESESELEAPRNEASLEPLGALHILLAEDNKVNQKLALKVLEKAGHRVVVVSDGQEAVKQYTQEKFDLILMDIQMPALNGIEATKEIRKLEEADSASIPIVALTAHAMVGDKEKYLSSGMDGYVSKPFKKKQLFAEMARVLSKESFSS